MGQAPVRCVDRLLGVPPFVIVSSHTIWLTALGGPCVGIHASLTLHSKPPPPPRIGIGTQQRDRQQEQHVHLRA